jgi:catechol 2,3-dioxygenase-like lactoylglutathione lyase family enzyme
MTLDPAGTTSTGRPSIASVASHIRFARPTGQIDALLVFYRDGLGLSKIDAFRGHRGFSGVILGLPGSELQIELVTRDDHTGQIVGRAPTNDNLLVFYLPDPNTVNAYAEKLADLGYPAVAPDNPYWLEQRAVTVEDPDGWRVVLVPSAYS